MSILTISIHANVLGLMAPTVVLFRTARSLRRVSRVGRRMGRHMSRMSWGSFPGEHVELEAKVEVANALEHTAELERPRNSLRAVEEVTHLHGITENPSRDN